MCRSKLELLKFLREQQGCQDAWVSDLHESIQSVFFDNPLVDSLFRVQDLLLQAAMGEAYTDAEYFLSEWKPADDGHIQIKEADGTEWKLETDEDFYTYFRKVCGE